jgi:hypothetical protein
MTMLEERRHRADIIVVFKILTGKKQCQQRKLA